MDTFPTLFFPASHKNGKLEMDTFNSLDQVKLSSFSSKTEMPKKWTRLHCANMYMQAAAAAIGQQQQHKKKIF